MLWDKHQHSFSKALLNGEATVPDTVRKTQAGQVSQRRFNVYRNNIATSLIEALADTFPTVCQLVGEDFFKACAQAFINQQLPNSPLLFQYGKEFPDFLDNVAQAQSVPYLSDVARLEWVWCQSYYAADATPVGIDALTEFADDKINEIIFEFHPALWLIRSDWPVASIWHAHQQDTPQELLKSLAVKPEFVLLNRPQLQVNLTPISEEMYVFFTCLKAKRPLAEAAAAYEHNDKLDLSHSLSTLFQSGAVIKVVSL